MAKKEIQRRFITLELNPTMTDKQELEFKEWVARGLKDIRNYGNNAVLRIPKIALRTHFEKESDIVVVNKRIIKP